MLDRLFELCREYDRLGWSVQEQFNDLRKGVDPGTLNPNALGMIDQFLDKLWNFFETMDEYETYQELEDISNLQARIQDRLQASKVEV